MDERIQQLVDQLKQMSKPLNLKEVQLHTDELLSRLSEEDETFRDLTKHCEKIHSLVVNLRILEKKQEVSTTNGDMNAPMLYFFCLSSFTGLLFFG